MGYRYLLIFFILFVPAVSPAQDEADRRYRVELIVLSHLRHDELPREQRWITDYSDAIDFLAPPPDDEEQPDPESGEQAMQPTPLPSLADPLSEAGEDGLALEDLEAEAPLSRVRHLPELGEEMQDAWRRLRLSGPFRPLQYLAWEQEASAPFPVLRIHDQELILEQDPWADQRLAAGEVEPEEPSAAAEPPPGETSDLEGDEDELPPPLRFYGLDGTVQLTRSRFLHLALDLALRQPVFERPVGSLGEVPHERPTDEEGERPAPPVPDAYRVHRLQQRRQVRTGRMEYFDGPVLGVLARVTRVEVAESERRDRPEGGWSE